MSERSRYVRVADVARNDDVHNMEAIEDSEATLDANGTH